ncbi:MAG: HD domain-containing protein [Lachnospiraceae bacterium]|nr:HD domain-containing protein [Lachnospiraceae bacterium]
MFRGNAELLGLFSVDDKAWENLDDASREEVELAASEDSEEAIDHGILVSNLALRLSEELKMDDEFCKKVARAGIVHDIGKLQISSLLYGRKEGVLRIEEIKYVRRHPTLGYNFLTQKAIGDEEFRNMILHHHENYDGSGFPDNMKGDTIPEGSRLLRICDVYAALVSERPYRAAFDKNTAMELMIDEVKNFDMNYFLAFMRIVHADDFKDIDDYITRCNSKVHVKTKRKI